MRMPWQRGAAMPAMPPCTNGDWNGTIAEAAVRAAGERVLLYFRRAPECEPRYLNRVKLYQFAT